MLNGQKVFRWVRKNLVFRLETDPPAPTNEKYSDWRTKDAQIRSFFVE